MVSRAWPWCVALAVAASYALTFGLNYGIDNHPVYLLQALKLLEPKILHNDWYASQAMQYHPVFSYIAAPLMRASKGGWGIALALTVTVSLSTAYLYGPLRGLVRSKWVALLAFVWLVVLMFTTETQSIAVSYIFNPAFQPSTLGSVGLLLSIGPFLRRRWLWSGIWLAFSGLFHANYLVLNVAVMGLAHLLLGGGFKATARRLLLQLGPSLVPLAILAAPMLHTVGGENAAEAQRILFQIRAPHHYFPRAYQRDLVLPLGWLALGLSCSKALPRTRALQLFCVWLLAAAVVIWVPTLLTSWTYVARIAQLFVWRLAPFSDLMGQALVGLAAARVLFKPRALRGLSTTDVGTIVAGMLGLASAYALRDSLGVSIVLVAQFGLGLLCFGVCWLSTQSALAPLVAKVREWRPIVGRVLPPLAVLAALALYANQVNTPLRQLAARSNVIVGLPRWDTELYDWVAKNTSVDAGFLTPPQDPSFRYFAKRAIVVDWKSTPMLPKDVIEWYERMKAVTGRPAFNNAHDLDGYKDLTPRKVSELRARYGFDYVVAYVGVNRGLDTLRAVYRNARYVVYDLR